MKMGPATQLGVQSQATGIVRRGLLARLWVLPCPRSVPSLNIGSTPKQCPRPTLT